MRILNAPTLSDAISIVKPEPDSHFRLIGCECGGDNAAYIKFPVRNGASWRVSCLDCGRTATADGIASMHYVQILWNRCGKTKEGTNA